MKSKVKRIDIKNISKIHKRPLPRPKKSERCDKATTKFPLDKLKIGQCFLIKYKPGTFQTVKSSTSRITQVVKHLIKYSKLPKNFKVVTRHLPEEKSFGVWRIR